jgi:hypothetical protein
MRLSGGNREVLLTAAGRPQLALKDVIQQLAAGIGPEVALSFAADQSISQQITLPQQPDEVLRAIVRNKVEGLAPWPLAQCLWGMRASTIAGDPQHVSVEVAVVSRALLDDLAATLRQAGAEVKALSVLLPDGEAVDIDLGSGDERRTATPASRPRGAARGARLRVREGLPIRAGRRGQGGAARDSDRAGAPAVPYPAALPEA